MNDRDNPYAGGKGQYSAKLDLGLPADGDAGAQSPGLVSGTQPEADAAAPSKETTTAGFSADVIEESRRQPVLVDFWAPWCGPCKQLTPALEKTVREAGGRVKLVKMNIDDHPAIPGQLGIQSIPAVIAFRDGQPVDGFMGAIPESQIRQFIEKVAGQGGGDPVADALAKAAEARENGDAESAAQIYSAIIQQQPDNADALGGLADLLYEAGQGDRAKEVLDRVPEASRDAAAVSAVRAKMALAEQVAGLGDPVELERRLLVDPNEHQTRFDLALIQNARGERDEAAENLLAILRAEREWNEGAAREQLLKFFEAWGGSDPATLAARRKLSSLLFA